jgi:hypothetical protein
MCVQIETAKIGGNNQTFLQEKAATKLDGPPASIAEVPKGKTVVADMTNYSNIHIVSGQADLEHLSRYTADYYLIDNDAIKGLF